MTQDTERWTIWRCPKHPDDVLGTRTDEDEPGCSLCRMTEARPMERVEVVPASSLQEVEREALLRIERQARDRYKAGDHESHGEMMAAHAARMEVVAEQAKACAREVERERDELRAENLELRSQVAAWQDANRDDRALSNPKEEQ